MKDWCGLIVDLLVGLLPVYLKVTEDYVITLVIMVNPVDSRVMEEILEGLVVSPEGLHA